jgi:hypothetical protein
MTMNAPASLNSVLSDELVRRALDQAGTRRPVEALSEAVGLNGAQFVAAAASPTCGPARPISRPSRSWRATSG